MLCQFSFQNFKSYKNETTFDLQAASIPEFEESLIKREKCSDLLPVGVIYGPNGGGKSNLLRALACLISTVVKPIHDLEKTRTKFIFQQKMIAEPYLYDDESAKEPTEFRIFFRTSGYEYQYYLALLAGEIHAETLSRRKIGGKRPAHLFYRENGVVELGAILEKAKVTSDKVNSKMPYLSFLAINYDIPAIVDVQKWFEACIIRSYANPIIEMRIIVADDTAVKHSVLQLLQGMDIDILDYRYDEQQKELYIKRRIGNTEFELSYEHESDGTKKLIAALPVLLMALQEGRLVIIDELDAKLHPKLLRYVISMFKDPAMNKHGAQLLFTSHDMATMKNTVFRRDEIWFAALDEEHSSNVYSLYDIRRENNERVNSTAAFDKQYLEGRYGADPYLQTMLSGGGWK